VVVGGNAGLFGGAGGEYRAHLWWGGVIDDCAGSVPPPVPFCYTFASPTFLAGVAMTTLLGLGLESRFAINILSPRRRARAHARTHTHTHTPTLNPNYKHSGTAASMTAPWKRRTCTTSSWPRVTALCRGVSPSLSMASSLQSLVRSSSLTASVWP